MLHYDYRHQVGKFAKVGLGGVLDLEVRVLPSFKSRSDVDQFMRLEVS